MEIKELGNDMVRISAPNGIKDIRNGWKGMEAIVHRKDVQFFVAV